jgi:hypothetical protein
MSFERPTRGLLVFQCDVCFDEQHEFSKADGADVSNFRECWTELHEEGWTMNGTEHLCPDCSATARDDRANPFRR